MKRINFKNVKPGDILFTARPGKNSKMIRFITRGIVSHAIICVQHGSFIDSTSDGVQARNFQRELFADCEKAFHFRLKIPPNQQVLSQIINHARAEIGARYSKLEAARSVLAIRKPRLKRQFCSRFVARVFRMAGINLVKDSDYCSPETLRRSPLLREIPVEFESVSTEELSLMFNRPNPIQIMHDTQNAVLDAARSVDQGVENFSDLYEFLVNRPEYDQLIETTLKNSGYLDIWKMEINNNPWRYSHELIKKIPSRPEYISEYCTDIVKEAYSGGFHFSVNLVKLQALQQRHPRNSFQSLIALYETLVKNDQNRREVAYEWLQEHYPNQLKQNMEQIEPHTPHWWSMIDLVEPIVATLSRQVVASKNSTDVCTTCGDQPASLYRLANGAETMPGVPSLRLCNDCIVIRREIMGNALIPFLSLPGET